MEPERVGQWGEWHVTRCGGGCCVTYYSDTSRANYSLTLKTKEHEAVIAAIEMGLPWERAVVQIMGDRLSPEIRAVLDVSAGTLGGLL